MAKKSQIMELALLKEDHTWDTESFDVPINGSLEDSARDFFFNDLAKKSAYRKVVLVAVYNESPEEELR